MYTVKPPNKEGSCYVLCREVVLLLEVQNVLRLYIGNQLFGTLKSVFCREVYYIMSVSWRVHYRRFYCMCIVQKHRMLGSLEVALLHGIVVEFWLPVPPATGFSSAEYGSLHLLPHTPGTEKLHYQQWQRQQAALYVQNETDCSVSQPVVGCCAHWCGCSCCALKNLYQHVGPEKEMSPYLDPLVYHQLTLKISVQLHILWIYFYQWLPKSSAEIQWLALPLILHIMYKNNDNNNNNNIQTTTVDHHNHYYYNNTNLHFLTYPGWIGHSWGYPLPRYLWFARLLQYTN